MLRKLGVLLGLVLLTVLAVQTRTPAQSTVNLQSDLFQLRQQVSQLQAQVSQLSRQGGVPSVAAPSTRRSPELSDAQIVDRLATLAIEAKQRLNSLEDRVTKLEKRVK